MSSQPRNPNAVRLPADVIWDVRRMLKEHGETAVRLAYHAALPVVVDPGLLNLLRVNFFLDPPDDLPYEAEAELLMSSLFREVSEGLYEIEPELRNLLLTGLYSPPYGPDRVRRTASLLEQYTDATAPWQSLPALEAAQRLTATSFLEPELARRWLDKNEAGPVPVRTDSETPSAGLRREWYVAMRRRANERAAIGDLDLALAQAAEFLDTPDVEQRVQALRTIGTIAGLLGANSDRVPDLLSRFVEEHGSSALSGMNRGGHDLQEALALLGTLPGQGVRLENVTLRGISLAGLNFSGARFGRVVLRDVDATGLNLTGARLENCILSDVRLDDARLDGARCEFADMRRVSLQRVSIIGAGITAEYAEEITATDATGAQWQVNVSDQPLARRQLNIKSVMAADTPESAQPGVDITVVRGEIPARDMNFTGRKEILNGIQQGLASYGRLVLHGLGGVGKTAIAVEYAQQYAPSYDSVLWIRADQRSVARASLAELAQRLGLEDTKTTSSIDTRTARFLDGLRRGEVLGRWLLIYDSAGQPDEIADLIPEGQGHVLITSRNPRWRAIFNTMPIDVFTRKESLQFLMKGATQGLAEADADRLAEKLGDLPLALAQASAYLSETGNSVQEYMQSLDKEYHRIMSSGAPASFPPALTAAWEISVDRLRAQMPEALGLVRLLAFFGSDPIPQDMLERGGRQATTDAREVVGDVALLARAVRELARRDLISLEGRSVRMPRLIQALIRDELSSDEQARYRQDVHRILATVAPNDPDDPRGWRDFGDLVPHLTSETVQLAQSRDEEVRQLALNAMRYLLTSGDPEACRTLAEMCIAQWTADSGSNSAETVRAKDHLDKARGQQATSRRRAKSVTVIYENELIPQGATITLELEGIVNQDSVHHVRRWLDADPERSNVTWSPDPGRPLRWAVEPGREWTPTSLRDEIFIRAGLSVPSFSAADVWCYGGVSLYFIANSVFENTQYDAVQSEQYFGFGRHRSSFWRMLGDGERESLRATAIPRSFGDNTLLCREGDPSTHVYIVLSGWVKIITVTSDGRESLAALRGEGDIVGDLAQVTGYRTATVQTAGPVRTLIVDAGQFEMFLDAHPEAARAYRRTATEHDIAAHNSQRSRALSSGNQRLAALLLDLDGTDVPLSQEELASLIGSSRATVTRILSNWRSRGIINTRLRRIEVLNPVALRQSRDSLS